MTDLTQDQVATPVLGDVVVTKSRGFYYVRRYEFGFWRYISLFSWKRNAIRAAKQISQMGTVAGEQVVWRSRNG